MGRACIISIIMYTRMHGPPPRGRGRAIMHTTVLISHSAEGLHYKSIKCLHWAVLLHFFVLITQKQDISWVVGTWDIWCQIGTVGQHNCMCMHDCTCRCTCIVYMYMYVVGTSSVPRFSVCDHKLHVYNMYIYTCTC